MSADRTGMPQILRLLLAGACVVVILAGVKAVAPTLTNFLIAFLLAQALSPLMLRLIRWKIPSGIAIVLTLSMVLIGGGLVITLVATSIASLAQDLPRYALKLRVIQEEGLAYLETWGVDTNSLSSIESLDPATLIGPAAKLATTILADLGHAFFVLLIMALFLIELAIIYRQLEQVDRSTRTPLIRMGEMIADLQKYLGITAFVSAIGAVAYTLLLMGLGVPFIPTWVVLYFLLSFIPAIGGIISIIPAAVITLLEYGYQRTLILVLVFAVGNFLLGDILKPKIMEKGFEISIVAVFFSLVFWNWLLGPIGMVLAVPITITLRKLYQEFRLEIRRAVLE